MNSRRNFLKRTAAVSAGITVLPNFTISGLGHKAPSDKLNIVGVGIGGKGFVNLKAMDSENIIGLCDVDWNYAEKCFNEFPKAKRYKDWRRMFDELGDSFDAVMISTPDHTHAIIAATAITLGKHVYCQKPLTHSVYESRLLAKLTEKYKVATQMGNQGNSSDDVRELCEWIWNGEIGEVREVHTWTNRPVWPQGLQMPQEAMRIPRGLDWDSFIGPAPLLSYHEIYHPWNWRGWWDFGTGAFGDMACHVIDPAYQALKLGFPDKVRGSSTKFNTQSAPQAETVVYSFPQRDNLPGLALPPVNLYWYDGGLLPMRLEIDSLMQDNMGGCLFIGSKDTLICDTGGINPRLLSGRVPQVEPYLRRVPGYSVSRYIDGPHEQDWIRACKEHPDNRTESSSSFSYAGPFNEMVLLGVLAVRLQALNRALEWDGDNIKFTNINENEILRVLISDDFEVIDGHPNFNNKFAELNALETANEYIKRTYRKGWSLPEMP